MDPGHPAKPGDIASGRIRAAAIRNALTPASDDRSEAASEAITAEMNLAMMNYMPLRGILAFGGGAIPPEAIEAILDKLNNA